MTDDTSNTSSASEKEEEVIEPLTVEIKEKIKHPYTESIEYDDLSPTEEEMQEDGFT